MLRKYITNFLIVFISINVLINTEVASARDMNIYVNDILLIRDVCQVDGFDMLPILDISGELGYYSYSSENSVVIYNDYSYYRFILGSAVVYGRQGECLGGLDIVPQYINNKFMIPAKFFQDSFGYSYMWDAKTDILFLNSLIKYNNIISLNNNPQEQSINDAYFVKKAKEMLGVPEYAEVTYNLSDIYFWDGGARFLRGISFYEGEELVACAEIDVHTLELVRGIYNYSKNDIISRAISEEEAIYILKQACININMELGKIVEISRRYWYNEITRGYDIPIYYIEFTGTLPESYKQLYHICIGDDGTIYGGL